MRGGHRDFVPAVALTRTPEQRQDQALSWNRPDEAFFAAGACHILAFRFIERYGSDARRLVFLRPDAGPFGSHLYVTDGPWAFDFNGWTPEATVLAESAAACRRIDPEWDYRRIIIDGPLDVFCLTYGHRLPGQYAFDPIARADAYIERFDSHPPPGPPP